MVDFANLTGPYFDSVTSSYGLRKHRLRHGGIEISPCPMITYNGPTRVGDLTFQNSDAEIMNQWTATIPKATLVSFLGSSWEDAIKPDRLWEILAQGETEWKWYRTLGKPIFSNDASDRIQLVFVAGFEGNNSLGFESPYVE